MNEALTNVLHKIDQNLKMEQPESILQQARQLLVEQNKALQEADQPSGPSFDVESFQANFENLKTQVSTITTNHENLIKKVKADLEACVQLVIAKGLATGHADNITDLMSEVLDQFPKKRGRPKKEKS